MTWHRTSGRPGEGFPQEHPDNPLVVLPPLYKGCLYYESLRSSDLILQRNSPVSPSALRESCYGQEPEVQNDRRYAGQPE